MPRNQFQLISCQFVVNAMIKIPASLLSSSINQADKFNQVRIIQDSIDIDLYYHLSDKPDDPILIFLNGAVDRSRKIDSIVFQRSTWVPEISAHCIFIADPTLRITDSLAIGWGLGNTSHHGIIAMKSALDSLIDTLETNGSISPKRPVGFFGSSAGGFQALCLGALYPESKASVINPQIDIAHYFDKELRNALWAAFGSESVDFAYRNFEERLNVFSFFKSVNNIPKISIHINTNSRDDLNRELPLILRFIKDTPKINDKFTLGFYSDPTTGHSPPNKEATLKIIKDLLGTIED